MSVILTNNEQVDLAVEFLDRYGRPAQVDGVPAWSVSDVGIGTLVIAEGGRAATFVTSGALGQAQIIVEADADLGEGLRTIAGRLDVEVRASEAVSVAISAGAPRPKEQ